MAKAIKDLSRENEALKKALHARDQHIAVLEEKLRLALHKRFAASSEKALPGQFNLFNEAEAISAEAVAEEATTTIPEHKRKKHGRKPLPDHIPRTRIEHDLPEPEKICGCGCRKTCIGEAVSEQLDIIPAKIQVLQHVRLKYACRSCEGVEDDGPAVMIAPMPPQPIPKSNASPGLLAHIERTFIVSDQRSLGAKFQDGLPLYRQETMFARIGVELPRSTMANWMIRAGDLIRPLINLMHETQLGYDMLQMDETTLQVLKEKDRAATSNSYMWVTRGGPPSSPIILFTYDPSRSGAVPLRLLADFKGYLQTDGYDGYSAVSKREDIIHVGCLAHARRKFDEAVKAQTTNKTGLARQGFNMIQRIYRIEREASGRELGHDERKQLRDEKAKPLWEEMRQWLGQSIGQAPPGTLTGKALGYLNTQWPRLIRYLDDGRLEADNNRAENAIRPFVMGRKAWLFSDTPAGAEASARLYSLIETAKANGIEPYAYLRQVFTELPRAENLADIEALLPYKSNFPR